MQIYNRTYCASAYTSEAIFYRTYEINSNNTIIILMLVILVCIHALYSLETNRYHYQRL